MAQDDFKKAEMAFYLSDQAAESEHIWKELNYCFFKGFKNLFYMFEKEGLEFFDVDWSTFKIEVKHKFSIMATDFRISVVTKSGKQVSTPYHMGPEDAQNIQMKYSSHSTPSDPINYDKLKELLLAEVDTFKPEPPKPKPLTYKELKEKAVREGKIVVKPLPEDDSGLV